MWKESNCDQISMDVSKMDIWSQLLSFHMDFNFHCLYTADHTVYVNSKSHDLQYDLLYKDNGSWSPCGKKATVIRYPWMSQRSDYFLYLLFCLRWELEWFYARNVLRSITEDRGFVLPRHWIVIVFLVKNISSSHDSYYLHIQYDLLYKDNGSWSPCGKKATLYFLLGIQTRKNTKTKNYKSSKCYGTKMLMSLW
jgi:hypothetical protein